MSTKLPKKLTRGLRTLLLQIQQENGQALVSRISLQYGNEADLNALKRLGLVEIVDHPIVENRSTKLPAAAVAITALGRATLEASAS